MKVGLFTNSLAAQGMTDLREIAQWAVEHGFEELEVGASIQWMKRCSMTLLPGMILKSGQ